MKVVLYIVFLILGLSSIAFSDVVMPLAKGFYPKQSMGIINDVSVAMATGL